eukprot:CAMPEP_0204481692 /NCGR_PEP_ID=MMETSP0471-20130131/48362_1 /ASSEMBLY_ACC=CAM_ASM_000602 /TAXON_ID=2969 /ORGANISM="Oxyrrhis marina" /LENGTH=149 /DNA_ID=CAMNT_0051484893 /DNA_START=329 /DNA_END=778 /DNA_ORIENTATION=-
MCESPAPSAGSAGGEIPAKHVCNAPCRIGDGRLSRDFGRQMELWWKSLARWRIAGRRTTTPGMPAEDGPGSPARGSSGLQKEAAASPVPASAAAWAAPHNAAHEYWHTSTAPRTAAAFSQRAAGVPGIAPPDNGRHQIWGGHPSSDLKM